MNSPLEKREVRLRGLQGGGSRVSSGAVDGAGRGGPRHYGIAGFGAMRYFPQLEQTP
jgi:hypothetical protein